MSLFTKDYIEAVGLLLVIGIMVGYGLNNQMNKRIK